MMTLSLITAASLCMTGCGIQEAREILDEFTAHQKSGLINQNSERKESGAIADLDGFGGIEIYTEEVGYVEEAMSDCYDGMMYPVNYNTEEYNAIQENGFRSVYTSPLSTFGADVDTASLANLRRMLNYGYLKDEIPAGAVRAEEMLNYFSYDYQGPSGEEPFGINAEIGECPWNPANKLLRIGLQTEKVDFSESTDSNIVFLIDVSGSMEDYDKLPLLKRAFGLLVDELGEKDRVSIVTYAGYDEVVLQGARGDEKAKIRRALNNLQADGFTDGGSGIISAYELAEKNFIESGNNRVILATDGDLNVGLTSQSELVELIEKEKKTGVYLSVLGFGTGNYSDANLEAIADKGNGNYSYIDSEKEAKKVLVEELGANMITVAKDVKLQIEFNPAYVAEYRQIGYENRAMAAEDFSDDTKDGGEIGAGHSVTVLYEIVPSDAAEEKSSGLKYQNIQPEETAAESGEWLTLSIRYKKPEEDTSELLEYPIGEESIAEIPSEDFIFQAAVAEFAMYLNDSSYLAEGSLRQVMDSFGSIEWSDEYQREFAQLIRDWYHAGR